MTVSEALMERSRLEEVVQELVVRNIDAAQSAFNVLTDCVGNGVDLDDEDASVGCLAERAKGRPDERSVLFLLEQVNGSIEDTFQTMKLAQDSGISPFKIAENIVLANQGDVTAAKELMKTMALHDGKLAGLKAGAVALDKKDLFQIRMQKMTSVPDIGSLKESISLLNTILPPGQAENVEKANRKCEMRNAKGLAGYISSLPFMSKGDPFLDNLKNIFQYINP